MSVAAAQAQALRRRTLDLAGHNVLIAAPAPSASEGSSLVSSLASGPVSQSEESAFVSTSSNLSTSHSTAASISPSSTPLPSDISSSAVPSATSASVSSAVSSAAAQKSTSSATSIFETSTTTLPASHSASPTMSSAKSSAKVTSTFALSVTKVQAVTSPSTSAAQPTSSSESSTTTSSVHSASSVTATTSKTASSTHSTSVLSTSKTQVKVPTTAASSSLNPITDIPSTSSTIPQVPATSTSAPPKSTTASVAPPSTPTTIATGGRGSVSSPVSSPSSVPTNIFSSATSRAGIVTGLSSSSAHAESTLSKPVSATLVSDGQTFTTAPSLITSLSTSTASGGSVATFSSVFANPTPVVVKSGIADNWDFFDDKGKVAGVFIAVALAIIALVGGIFYCRRRRRRAAASHAMMISDNRFHRDMAEQHTTYHPGRLPGGFGTIPDDPQRYLMAPSIGSGGHSALERSGSMSSHRSHEAGQAGVGAISALGLSGIHNRTGSQTSPVDPFRYEGPFSDYQNRFMVPFGTAVGIAVSGDPDPEPRRTESAHQRPPSPAPSSPSVYPPSLPPVPEKDEKEVDDLFYEQETKRRPIRPLPQAPQKAYVERADVQDPFASPLDDYYNSNRTIERRRPPPAVPTKILTGQAYQPLTPPDSSQGHSPAMTPTTSESPAESVKQPSPFANGFLGRPVKSEPMRPKRNPLRAANSLDRPSSSSSSGHA